MRRHGVVFRRCVEPCRVCYGLVLRSINAAGKHSGNWEHAIVLCLDPDGVVVVGVLLLVSFEWSERAVDGNMRMHKERLLLSRGEAGQVDMIRAVDKFLEASIAASHDVGRVEEGALIQILCRLVERCSWVERIVVDLRVGDCLKRAWTLLIWLARCRRLHILSQPLTGPDIR